MVQQTVNSELTEDEVELYDRQIRLWGLESQKRLRNAKVLIIGMKGFGAEVCKNVVLAGVRSVTLMDDGVLCADEWAQFLAPRTCVGQNRAEASLEQARALNPMVDVVADKSPPSLKPDSFYQQFDIVVVTSVRPTTEAVRINAACRLAGVKFIYGDVWGTFGFTFSDFLIHEYAEEVSKPLALKGEPTKVTAKGTTMFVPLRDALEVDWKSENYSSKLKKMDPCYFLMKVLLRFCNERGRDPSPSEREYDIKELIMMSKDEMKQLNVPEDFIPDDLFQNVFSQVSPVCAIVGGVMAQEVIKALSQKEQPHNNMFFFNPLKNLGYVDCIGS